MIIYIILTSANVGSRRNLEFGVKSSRDVYYFGEYALKTSYGFSLDAETLLSR